MDTPKRRHTVKITLQADTWEDIEFLLQQIEYDILTHQPGNIRIASGSPTGGYSIEDELRPEMDHDRYIKELNAYLGIEE